MKNCMSKLNTFLLATVLTLSMLGCNAKMSTDELKESVELSEIIIGESVDFASFDPFGDFSAQGFSHYSKLIYETLVNYENGEPVPSLAESWESDGNTWTFYLREDVTFTDGTAFNAEVVKMNIDALQSNVADAISYYRGVSMITEVEIVEEYIVKFHYEEPYFGVLQDLSAGAFGILSPSMFSEGNVPYGSVFIETVGTGAYVLNEENFTAGTSYTFDRNDNYYKKETGPDRFTVKIIPDADSRMMALQSGEIDLLNGSYQITYDMYDYLKDVENLEAVQSDTIYATRNLLLNTASVNLTDPLVRKAIQHGINKEQINNTVLHGLEQVAETLFPKSLPNCDVEQIAYDYDLNLATSLLDEAGWTETDAQGIRMKDGQTLSLEVIYMSERTADEQILMAFKGQMAELGIEIIISGYETMTWFEKGLAGEFDISVNDTYGFPQDPNVFIAAMLDYGLDFPAQQGLSQKPKIDNQILSMLTTVDENVIKDAYTYVLSTLQEEAVNVPITNIQEIAIYNSDKIESVTFSDDPIFSDISKIVIK